MFRRQTMDFQDVSWQSIFGSRSEVTSRGYSVSQNSSYLDTSGNPTRQGALRVEIGTLKLETWWPMLEEFGTFQLHISQVAEKWLKVRWTSVF